MPTTYLSSCKKIALLLTLFHCFLPGTLTLHAKTISEKHKAILQQVVDKYDRDSSFTYEVIYDTKCFDCDTFNHYEHRVQLIRNQADSVFKSYFFYSYLHNGVTNYKYYNGTNLYVIDSREEKITSFDPHAKRQTGPITSTYDGNIIQYSMLLHPDVLHKEFFSNPNLISVYDTIVNNQPYVVFKTVFEDEGDITEEYRNIYIHAKNPAIAGIYTHVRLLDQTQVTNVTIRHFKPGHIQPKDLEQLFQKAQKQHYKEEIFETPKRDSLALGTTIIPFSGKIYPDNETVRMSNSGKVTLFDFWYTACMPCIKSIPDINKIYNKYKDKIQVYGINPYPNDINQPEKIAQFLNRTPIDYPILLTEWDDLTAYKVRSFPTLYLFDKNGTLIFLQYGLDMQGDLFEVLDKILSGLEL